MHMLIYALVEASTQEDALAAGKSAFDQLVGASPHRTAVFDYCVCFDEETPVAGASRWGELPVAAPVESDEGAKLLDHGWKATESEFQCHLERVREALADLTDEEIMRDTNLARHAFHQVGAYDGPTISLYNEFGSGIRHRQQLDRILEGSEGLWVVPEDVHF